MIKYTIKAPSQLNASINLPASKSISNRALVISAMAGSHIQPDNLSDCDDTEVIVAALQNMSEVINIKAAGTAMRFMTAYLSAIPGEHTITGTERMQNRPIGILVDALRYLGADITYEKKEGYPPLHIRGKALHLGAPDDRSDSEERTGAEADRRDCIPSLHRPYALDDEGIWCRCRLDGYGHHHREATAIQGNILYDRKRLECFFLLV